MTREQDFFWLVGILEGEGSFLRPSPSKPNLPKIDIEMKDEPVIQRVSALFGASYRFRKARNPRAADTFHLRIEGTRATRVMWALRPFLSLRRQVQIDRALSCVYTREAEHHPEQLPVFTLETVCATPLCSGVPRPPTLNELYDGCCTRCGSGESMVVSIHEYRSERLARLGKKPRQPRAVEDPAVVGHIGPVAQSLQQELA